MRNELKKKMGTIMKDKCQVNKCKREVEMIFYNKRICDKCYEKYPLDKLKEIMKVRDVE